MSCHDAGSCLMVPTLRMNFANFMVAAGVMVQLTSGPVRTFVTISTESFELVSSIQVCAVCFGLAVTMAVASFMASTNAAYSSGLSLRNRAEVQVTVKVCGPSTSNDDSTVWMLFCSSCWNWNGGTLNTVE